MADEEHDRFVSIGYFTQQMLGFKTRDWYYDHVNDPGMPQRVMVGSVPKLSLKDCAAYVERLKKEAEPPPPPKRKRGRPRKITQPAAAA